ncbi:hypothetical protein KKD37_01270 [Patescibacteria group bacterium]|nr:hypothetical protein [Patescibacteria group bacterium]
MPPRTSQEQLRQRTEKRSNRFPAQPQTQAETPVARHERIEENLLKIPTHMASEPKPIGDVTFLDVRQRAGTSKGKRPTPPKRP